MGKAPGLSAPLNLPVGLLQELEVCYVPSHGHSHHQRQVLSPRLALAKLAGSPAPSPAQALPSQQRCSIPTKRTRQGPSFSCTALESVSSSTGLGCQGNSRHSMSFSTSTRPCRVITSPWESSTIRVGMPARKGKQGGISQGTNWPATGCGEKSLFLSPPALAGAQRAALPLRSSCGNQGPWILSLLEQSTVIQQPEQEAGRQELAQPALCCPSAGRGHRCLMLSDTSPTRRAGTLLTSSLLPHTSGVPAAHEAEQPWHRHLAAAGRAQSCSRRNAGKPFCRADRRHEQPGVRVCSFPEGAPYI